MTAVACIRVVVADGVRLPPGMDLAALVTKITSAYLETTWLWPRRFGVVAPFAFALSDPRATSLDAREIQALAQALNLKLFGDGGAEDGVRLLMLEGEPDDVMEFAARSPTNWSSCWTGTRPASSAGSARSPGAASSASRPLGPRSRARRRWRFWSAASRASLVGGWRGGASTPCLGGSSSPVASCPVTGLWKTPPTN